MTSDVTCFNMKGISIPILLVGLGYNLLAQSPEEIAQKICENYISSSSFEITESPVDPIQEGILVTYLEEGRAYEIETIITTTQMGRWFMAFAANPGQITVWMDEQLAYRGEVNTQGVPQALSDEIYQYEFKTLVPAFQGDYKLTIQYQPAGKSNTLFMWLIDEQNRVQSSIDFRSDFNFMEPYPFRYRVVNSTGNFSDWQYPKEATARQHSSALDMNDWQAHTGMMLDAMWNASDVFSLINAQDYVKNHLDFFVNELQTSPDQNQSVPMIRGSFFRYQRYNQLDDFGPQSVPFLHPEENENYRKFVSKGLNRIMYKTTRLPEGAFARIAPDSLTIKADDLYYGTVLLCRAYVKNKSRKHLREAIKQVILYDHWLKDPLNGLYWHAYFTGLDERSSSKWARANGLALLAKTELLKAMPVDHPERESILKIYRDHAAAIRTFQDLEGGWHQLIDKEDTFIETSATAMFVQAFADGVTNKWVFNKDEFQRSAIAGWEALKKMIDEDGNVDGICEETPILYSDSEYQNRQVIINNPFGLATVLNACIAVHKLGQ